MTTDWPYAALLRTAAGLLASSPEADWLTAQADKPTPDALALSLAASVVNANAPKPPRRWRTPRALTHLYRTLTKEKPRP